MKRVLIVEDDLGIARVLRRILAGTEVHLFSTVAEGLRALDEMEWDVVVTDYDLPDGKGSAVVTEARRLGLPVYVFSGAEPQEGLESIWIEKIDALQVRGVVCGSSC